MFEGDFYMLFVVVLVNEGDFYMLSVVVLVNVLDASLLSIAHLQFCFPVQTYF